MKGFIVVDRLNDIQFIDTDKEFARHINQQAKDNGLLPVKVCFKKIKIVIWHLGYTPPLVFKITKFVYRLQHHIHDCFSKYENKE